jgi:hypothetical protein
VCASGWLERERFKPDEDVGLHLSAVFHTMHLIARIWIGIVGAVAMALPLVAQGALVWDAREIKVEGRANEREIVAAYRFKNAGSSPVAITEIVSSCDCTTTELTKRIYAPGEEGTLTARLAVGSQAGLQKNTLAVITDDSDEPVILHLSANIQPLVKLTPQLLSWRTGMDPEENSTVVVAATPLRIASLVVSGIHPAEAATARVETVDDGTQYRVDVRPASVDRTLNFTISCSVKFADGTAQELVVYGAVRK